MKICLPTIKDNEIKLCSHPYKFLFFQGTKTFIYTIYRDDICIGSFDISTEFKDFRKVEIGYNIHKNYRNKGYATRCIKLVCDMLYQQYNTQVIFAYCYKSNPISIKILKKNGFLPVSETYSILKLEKPLS